MNRAAPLAAFVALALCACRQDSHPPLALAEDVDLERFMGDWYVIANIPTRIERGAHNAVESYRLADDGTIETTFTFRKDGFDGELKRYTPRGFVREGTGNAVWGMRFVWPVKADYRIAWLDRDYTLTVVGREARDYVWIMARRPQIAESDYLTLAAFVADQGYDVSKSAARAAALGGDAVTASRLALALRRWVDSGADAAVPDDEAEDRVDWARVLPFVGDACRLPRRPRDRSECHGDHRRGRAVPGPHVRDHGVLSPLLFPSRLPRLARRAVRVRAAGRLGRAARPAVVGGASPASPRARGPPGRPPLPRPAGLPAQPLRLVPGARELRDPPRASSGPRALPGAALARPLRRRRPGRARRAAVRNRRLARTRGASSRRLRRPAPGVGVLHLDGRCSGTRHSRSIRSRTGSAAGATRRATTRATTPGWRC